MGKNGVEKDLKFIQKVKQASVDELLKLQANHGKKSAPWKRVAIERALRKALPTDYEECGICGYDHSYDIPLLSNDDRKEALKKHEQDD